MTTLCFWIPSLSSPVLYLRNSLVLISLLAISTILWISLLYSAHLIFGFEIGLNKRLWFCLALVCIWFLISDVTVRSDQHGASRPSPASAEARSTRRPAGVSTATAVGRHAVRTNHDAPDGYAFHYRPSGSPQPKRLGSDGVYHWLRISSAHTCSTTREPRTSTSTSGEVRRISRRVPADLPSPASEAQVAYIITELTGKARKWGTATWSTDLPCIWSSQRFMQEMPGVRPSFHRFGGWKRPDATLSKQEVRLGLFHRFPDSGNWWWMGGTCPHRRFPQWAFQSGEGWTTHKRPSRGAGSHHRTRYPSRLSTGGSQTHGQGPLLTPALQLPLPTHLSTPWPTGPRDRRTTHQPWKQTGGEGWGDDSGSFPTV